MLVIYSSETSIRAGAFKTDICDLVTLFVSVNASDNWFATLYKWIIVWTSRSPWFVRGSKWDNDDAFYKSSYFFSFCFSPPNPENIVSLNWQSANRVVNISPVNDSIYLIIDRDLNPT